MAWSICATLVRCASSSGVIHKRIMAAMKAVSAAGIDVKACLTQCKKLTECLETGWPMCIHSAASRLSDTGEYDELRRLLLQLYRHIASGKGIVPMPAPNAYVCIDGTISQCNWTQLCCDTPLAGQGSPFLSIAGQDVHLSMSRVPCSEQLF